MEYTNRKGHRYHLRTGNTKTGRPTYYFSQKAGDLSIHAIPSGFEIYENPKGQPFLRKIVPQLITDTEVSTIQRELDVIPRLKGSRVERKREVLTIYVVDRNEELVEEFRQTHFLRVSKSLKELPERHWSFDAELEFVLVDKTRRLYKARRFCYLGSVDDWIEIGEPGSLNTLAKRYVKRLGRESFFELF